MFHRLNSFVRGAAPSGLSILTGVFWAAANPLWGFWPLVFVILVPLVLLSRPDRSALALLKEGLWAQLIFCAGTFFWIPPSLYRLSSGTFWLNMILFGALCLLTQLPTAFLPVLAKQIRFDKARLWKVLFLTVSLTLAEAFYPKLLNDTFGNAFEHQTNLLSYVAFPHGTLVLTFIALLANFTIAFFLENKHWRTAAGFWMGLVVVIYLLPARAIGPFQSSLRPLEVVSINTSFPLTELTSAEGARRVYSVLLKTLESLPDAGPEPRLVVLPETIYPLNPLDRTHPANQSLERLVQVKKLDLLFGAHVSDGRRTFNAVVYMRPGVNGAQIDYIAKRLLFPFGESTPLIGQIPFLRDSFKPPIKYDLPQGERSYFLIHGLKVGVAICYESIFPEWARAFASPLDLLINNTNEAYFAPFGEPQLSFALTVFTSVENRLTVVRTSNGGSGGVIEGGFIRDEASVPSEIDIRHYQLRL